ncbi:MAG: SulP family inorganic anion transporter [Chloroflexi bacterium]|nr:SulP family inorganic anion transporter [Chloroflexota bacterium]
MSYTRQALRGDLFGGVAAAVVGLPFALAFGVASGLGPMAGLYGAIAVGFFAAVFGGTRSQISGPTAPIAMAMAVVVATHADSMAEAFTVVIMAGLIQTLLGAIRVGRFVAYAPFSVISGLLSGVGIIIILVQTLPFVGAPVAIGGPVETVRAWLDARHDVNYSALAIAVVTLAVVVAWPKRLRTYLPPTLVALLAGTLLSALWLSDTPVVGDVSAGLPELQLPDVSVDALAGAVLPALIIALLGAIDSLLTSRVADSMTRTRHDQNRELIGQGIGNMAVGFIGGLPGAGVTPGTVANLRAGGRTPVSGALRAAILLALVLALGRYVEFIPHAALAGILIKIGWDIIDWQFLTRIHRVQPEHLLVMAVTLGLTLVLDLVTAVAIGLIAAAVASARQFERLDMDSVVSTPLPEQSAGPGSDGSGKETSFAERVGLVSLTGSFSVISASKLINTISADIRLREVVILDFSDTVYMDDSAALVLERMIDMAIAEDTTCVVMGLGGRAAITLHALNVLRRVPADHFVATLDDAQATARRLLES